MSIMGDLSMNSEMEKDTKLYSYRRNEQIISPEWSWEVYMNQGPHLLPMLIGRFQFALWAHDFAELLNERENRESS